MKELQIFSHEMFGNVRVTTLEGKPHFVANDILRSLGYEESGWRKVVSRKCKHVTKCHGVKVNGSEVNLIPEGDVYRLIVGSKLNSAEKFELWVFDEVLPTIRETGKYEMKKKPRELQLAEALITANEIITELNDKIDNTPITSIQVKQISIQLTMKASQYNKSKEVRKHLEKVLKDRFDISTFQEIKTKDYNDVLEFIKGYTYPSDRQLELF